MVKKNLKYIIAVFLVLVSIIVVYARFIIEPKSDPIPVKNFPDGVLFKIFSVLVDKKTWGLFFFPESNTQRESI